MMEWIGLVVILLVSGVTLMALFTLINLMLPGAVQGISRRMETNLLRAFLVGLVNTLFFGAVLVLCAWLAQQAGQAGKILLILAGGLIALIMACFILTGLAAQAKLLGERLGGSKTPLSGILRGALLLILSCLTPFVGWYLVTPAVFIAAFGAVILTLFQRRSIPATQPAAEEIEKPTA